MAYEPMRMYSLAKVPHYRNLHQKCYYFVLIQLFDKITGILGSSVVVGELPTGEKLKLTIFTTHAQAGL